MSQALQPIIGSDVFDNQKDSRNMRNKVFTAFTRAKVWLRISGLNLTGSALEKEILALKENDYRLQFRNVSSYKLDRDWKKRKEHIERHKEFEEVLQRLMEQTGVSEREALIAVQQFKNIRKAAMMRENVTYGSEDDE